MPVSWAQKLQFAKDTPLRGFTEMGTSPRSEFVYLKDAFEFGAHSQLFVGIKNGERRIFKCVSALPSHTPDGWRHAIAQEKADLAISMGRLPSMMPWQDQGTMPRCAVMEEVSAVRACKAAFARSTVIVATKRPGVREASKYFYVMPPAPTDLLGCIHALEREGGAMRRNVALVVLGQLALQLHDMHVIQGKAHRDVRSENILGNINPKDPTEVLLWDFGLTITGDQRSIEPWVREDMHRLGKVFAMLLAPDLRKLLEGDDLSPSLEILGARFPDLLPILAGLLDTRPEHRWTAAQLCLHLDARPPGESPEADVRAFMPTVRPLMDAIEAKWEVFMEALRDFAAREALETSDDE